MHATRGARGQDARDTGGTRARCTRHGGHAGKMLARRDGRGQTVAGAWNHGREAHAREKKKVCYGVLEGLECGVYML